MANPTYNTKERHLIELAQKGWNNAIKEFYYPPLSEPNYIFDYSNLEGFYIDPANKWIITMNLANAPLFVEDKNYVDYFFAIILHEVSHYVIIPYDGLINAKLLKAAMRHVSQYFAPVVVNIFADLIIDRKLFFKNPQLIEWELKCTFDNVYNKYHEELTTFSKFLFRCYELLLGIHLMNKDFFEGVEALANKVVKIIQKNFEDETKWEEKVSKIANILKQLINNTFNIMGSKSKLENRKTKRRIKLNGDVEIMFPEEILEVLDNPLENKNIDKIKKDNEDDLRKKAEEFAKDVQYSEFGAPASLAGILIDGNPLATWYRGHSRNLIEIKITQLKLEGSLPVYPEVWRIGDPIENLDFIQSLLVSPILIPNITTRKWTKKFNKGIYTENTLPDLLLVIDSSGSMNWNYSSKRDKGKYHTALIASFAALHFAARKGVKFSVINFSNKAEICDWTYDFHNAEQVLLRYQGGGTELPTKAIIRQCKRAERTTLILVITDFGIYNWTSSKKAFMTLLEQGHNIVGFFIGTKEIPLSKFKELLQKMKFYPILKPTDLIDLIIDEVKNYYLD